MEINDYSPMKIKKEMYREDTTVEETYETYYMDWEHQLDGSCGYWNQFCDRYAESCQYAVLRALTVIGIIPHNWESVFCDIYEEHNAFCGLSRQFWEDDSFLNWRFWAQKLALDPVVSVGFIYYPCFDPQWLIAYKYTHRQYIEDLAVYWDDIHDSYYKLWSGERYGDEILPIAQIKEIGEATRREIDRIAQHANGRIYVEGVS